MNTFLKCTVIMWKLKSFDNCFDNWLRCYKKKKKKSVYHPQSSNEEPQQNWKGSVMICTLLRSINLEFILKFVNTPICWKGDKAFSRQWRGFVKSFIQWHVSRWFSILTSVDRSNVFSRPDSIDSQSIYKQSTSINWYTQKRLEKKIQR